MNTAITVENLVLGPEHNGLRLSVQEFDAVTDYNELYTYELLHGVLVVNPIPSPQERGPNEELARLLREYRDNHPQGTSLDDTLSEEYVRTTQSRRRADRVIWTGLGRQPDPALDPPSIVVEFVSAGRQNWQRDYIEKRDEYLALGVSEYWVVDRFRRVLTVFSKRPSDVEEKVIREQETYRSALLPGFELPLGRLLAAADRWGRAQGE